MMENDRVSNGCGEFDALELYDGDVLPLEDFLWKKVKMLESQNQDSAFMVADLGEIYRRIENWRKLLPRVDPLYALKCNPHPVVARFMADAGVGFDCASKVEIQLILNLGVHPSRIIYANPFKQISYLTYAADNNVDLMTFDDIHELVKIKKYYPTARLILRMATRDEVKVIHNFNNKFGCPLKQCKMLLTQALTMELNVVGVSFHAGGHAEKVDCYISAIEDAHSVFKMGRVLGFQMEILNIGGGFPGTDTGEITFSQVADAVNKSLDQYFPDSDGVRVIAEPGRYFVTTAFTLTVNVIAKKVEDGCNNGHENKHNIMDTELKELAKDREWCMEKASHLVKEDSLLYTYIVNQGKYGTFANVAIDKFKPSLNLLTTKNDSDPEMHGLKRSKIYGPTCAPCDCVIPECQLPEIQVGQWFYVCNMGAYSLSLTSAFNGIEEPLVFPVCSRPYWQKVFSSTEAVKENIHFRKE